MTQHLVCTVPLRRVFLQHRADEPHERGGGFDRRVIIVGGEGGGLSLHGADEDLHGFKLRQRRIALEEFQCRDAQGPDVCLGERGASKSYSGVVPLAIHDLRSHPARRADEGARLLLLDRALQDTCHAKVRQTDVRISVDEDVARLHVSAIENETRTYLWSRLLSCRYLRPFAVSRMIYATIVSSKPCPS